MTMTRFERWSVWLTTTGTLLTGLAYWWMKDLMPASDPWAVINHPLQPWALKAHILVAPLMVFSVGLITTRHVWRHFRMNVRKGRKTGLTAALSFIVLVLSGYILQVVTGETILRVLAWTHLGLGVLYSLALAAHWPATRARRGARAEAPGGTRAQGAKAGERRPGLGVGASEPPGHDRRRRARRRQRAPGAAGD